VEAIGKLLSSSEAMKGVAKETYDKIKKQYLNVSNALYSVDKAYEGDAAKQAGKDLGKLIVAMGEVGGIKGLSVAAKGAGKVAIGARASTVATKVADLIAGGKKADVARAGHVKPEGNYSGLNDPANTYRAPSDNKLRAGKDHPNRTGTIARNPDVLKGSKDYKVSQTTTAKEMNQAMREKGETPAWRDSKGNVVQLGTLKPGAKIEMIVNEGQAKKISEGDLNAIGEWASEVRLPNKIQSARDAASVKRAWKDDSKGQKLYKIVLKVKQGSKGIETNRGVAGAVKDEGINRKLPGGVIQHQFKNKIQAADFLELVGDPVPLR